MIGLSLLLFVVGCGYAPPAPPEHFPSTAWEGSVWLAGTPIDVGWVTLYPMAGTVGDPVSTRIRPGGKFYFSSAPIGQVAIRINLPRSFVQEIENSSAASGRLLQRAGGPGTPFRGDTSVAAGGRFELLDQR